MENRIVVSAKANKAVMAEILATQAHLAELIASIS